MVTTMLGLDFARSEISDQEGYTIFQKNQKVAKCYVSNGEFSVTGKDDALIWKRGILGESHLNKRERLFFLMQAAREVHHFLSPKELNWEQPLCFRESISSHPESLTPLPGHSDGQSVFVMVEYEHPATGKLIADIWNYELETGRPLNPELRMNPMRRYDIINK